VETVYKILQKLGEADLETIVEEALKAGIPPPVATRHLTRLVEKKRVKVICDVVVRYRPT
jgi:DNA-binding MarR family transcriptional regulator